MPVSKIHISLVNLLIKEVEKKKNFKKNYWFYHDNPEEIDHERPPKIGESYPDLLADSIKGDFSIIGEAKASIDDLISVHAEKQIKDYFKYIEIIGAGEFIIAVPEELKKKAEEIINKNTADMNKEKIKTLIIYK